MDPMEAALRSYLESNGERPIQPDELRTALAVGERRLRRLFAAVYRETPNQYLRRHRLRLARQRLQDGAEDRVTDVGMRYGFFDLGRFASQYRELFDELPSETLRRHRAAVD